jgi:hypothetical protein
MKLNPMSGKPAMTYLALAYQQPAPDPVLPFSSLTIDRRGQLDFSAALQTTCRHPAAVFSGGASHI